MERVDGGIPGSSMAHRNGGRYDSVDPKHRVFLSHSGAQKDFVEQLCEDLRRRERFAFFDKRDDSLPIGESFPKNIFGAIEGCDVGVVILSEDFFTRSAWPMMELAAMVKQAELRERRFKIMPVFYGSSVTELKDRVNRSRWLARWHEMSLLNRRINVEDWEAALKYLHPINSLIYAVKLGEVKFREKIVDAICKAVRPEVRLHDSHIEGRSRLCKVIRDKICIIREDRNRDVCVVGLYGMGGIGKTSICKALCNEYCEEFDGRVCHAELERGSQKELLREVLKRVTATDRGFLDGLNEDELLHALQRVRDPIFLAVDNMSDSDSSMKEAKSYLSPALPRGSIVMVTARSMSCLRRVRQYIDESACLEMPELKEEEAKCLFVRASGFETRNERDEQLVMRCVKRCYFGKGDESESQHYHPLALDVLGRQLGCIDPKDWGVQLDKIEKDIFNQSRDNRHPIFSILRKSFDALLVKDQLLFMDVALFLPGWPGFGLSTYEWLGTVHRIPRTEDVIERLDILKRKSLLEKFGDGGDAHIGMHDLWRAFCVAESKCGELKCRRWVREAGGECELIDTSPAGGCGETVERMAFLDCKATDLEKVNFAGFPNVTVLKISGPRVSGKLVLDISGLINLKSLEISGVPGDLALRGLPSGLRFLGIEGVDAFSSDFPRRRGVPRGLPRGLKVRCLQEPSTSEEFVKEIGWLNEQRGLRLCDDRGGKVIDMSRMASLQVAWFFWCKNMVTLTGFCSEFTNLRCLNVSFCKRLRSLPGVGDLISLEELYCRECEGLEGLPNLQKLTMLRKLDVWGCPLLTELPGLGDLVALEELDAGFFKERSQLTLPDMVKLRNLQVFEIRGRRLKAVPGFESLVSLRKVKADFGELVDSPNLQQLTNMQDLEIAGWPSSGLRGLDNLTMLQRPGMRECRGVDKLPDFHSMIQLQHLRITECEFTDVSSLCNLKGLESLVVGWCKKLERLPDLRRLTRLKSLEINFCYRLSGWDCSSLGLQSSSGTLSQLQELYFISVSVLELPDLSYFPRLESLTVWDCNNLTRLTSRESNMHTVVYIIIVGCSSLATVPDLSTFPRLRHLEIWACEGITRLSCPGPLAALTELEVGVSDCLEALPDLGMFPALRKLRFYGCARFTTFSLSAPMPILQRLLLCGWTGLEAVPDLGMFPALESLRLEECNGLTALTGSAWLPALKKIKLTDCGGLKAVSNLGMFPALQKLELRGCSQLTTLSCSEALTSLEHLDLSDCTNLSENDISQLRTLCPQCKVVGV